jgi:hypothetical protein
MGMGCLLNIQSFVINEWPLTQNIRYLYWNLPLKQSYMCILPQERLIHENKTVDWGERHHFKTAKYKWMFRQNEIDNWFTQKPKNSFKMGKIW